MSRTREISGIVTRTSGIGDKAVYQFIENGQSQGIYEKARLIIELPERKVTISESEFEQLWRDACKQNLYIENITEWMRNKLFKDA